MSALPSALAATSHGTHHTILHPHTSVNEEAMLVRHKQSCSTAALRAAVKLAAPACAVAKCAQTRLQGAIKLGAT